LYVYFLDFMSPTLTRILEEDCEGKVDLIVGCCLADLFPPEKLAQRIADIVQTNHTIVYLPITFEGSTSLTGRVPQSASGTLLRPSKHYLAQYHSYLAKNGHFLSPQVLIECLRKKGARMDRVEDFSFIHSDWLINPQRDAYMWACMMRFLALGVVMPALLAQGKFKKFSGCRSWLQALVAEGERMGKSVGDWNWHLKASNIDILAVFPSISSLLGKRKVEDGETKTRFMIEFTAPSAVRVITESIPTLINEQALIASTHSLISTGTELKTFLGDIANDEPIDATFAGQQNLPTYPLRYGYSLVGRVIDVSEECTPEKRRKWMNEVVFGFQPHGSHHICPLSSLQVIPSDVSPQDAVFMPSVVNHPCLLYCLFLIGLIRKNIYN
jgi:hypothetical protein